LLTEAVSITSETTAASLHDALAAVGARLIVDALAGLADGNLTSRPQPGAGITVAPKLERGEGRMNWRCDAADLERSLRALNPWPGTWFEHTGDRLRVLSGVVVTGKPGASPGTILDDHLTVACGNGALRLTRLQRPGKSATEAEAFLRGYPLAKGLVLA
jgi:methionyl-tRNA formyltransferase